MTYPFVHSVDFIKNFVSSHDNEGMPEFTHDTFDRSFFNVFDKYIEVRTEVSFFFDDIEDVSIYTKKTVEFLSKLNDPANAIYTPCILLCALEQLGFNEDQDKPLIRSVLMAALLSEIKNDLPYHNNLHYRKVIFHTIRMIVAHNSIFREASHVLDKSQMASLIIAACIHDFLHLGQGNIVDRKYHFAKTEQYSFEMAKPYLKQCGLSDEILHDIRIMLICTDVSPFGDPISPVSQMKTAYEYHFGSAESENELDLCDELQVLETNSGLCRLALILHEADIMNSAAVSYEVTCCESVYISIETGRKTALPEDTLLFLDVICGGGMFSDAARYIGDHNFRDIQKQVLDDYNNGNLPYTE